MTPGWLKLLAALVGDVVAMDDYAIRLEKEHDQRVLAKAANVLDLDQFYARAVRMNSTYALRVFLQHEACRLIPPPSFGDDSAAWEVVRGHLWHQLKLVGGPIPGLPVPPQ